MHRHNSLPLARDERQDFCADTKGGEGLKRPKNWRFDSFMPQEEDSLLDIE